MAEKGDVGVLPVANMRYVIVVSDIETTGTCVANCLRGVISVQFKGRKFNF